MVDFKGIIDEDPKLKKLREENFLLFIQVFQEKDKVRRLEELRRMQIK